MLKQGPNIEPDRCIAYSKNKFDSHAAFDFKKGRYTFVVTGEYYFSFDRKTYFKGFFKAGSWVDNVEYIQKVSCSERK